MRKWLYDNPWIWIVILLTVLVSASMSVLVIAELNKPEILPHEAGGARRLPRSAHWMCAPRANRHATGRIEA